MSMDCRYTLFILQKLDTFTKQKKKREREDILVKLTIGCLQCRPRSSSLLGFPLNNILGKIAFFLFKITYVLLKFFLVVTKFI